MKNRVIASAIVLVSALPLTSCIAVDDFGTYWSQAVPDRAIVGSWKQIQATVDQTRAHGYGIGNITTFVQKGDAFEMTATEQDGKAVDRSMGNIKTLKIGNYDMIAFPAPNGMLDRYEIHGSAMNMCMAIGPAQVEWVEQHYPQATSVHKNHDEGEYLAIDVLDKEAYDILASIPATDEYWDCSWKFVRVPTRAR